MAKTCRLNDDYSPEGQTPRLVSIASTGSRPIGRIGDSPTRVLGDRCDGCRGSRFATAQRTFRYAPPESRRLSPIPRSHNLFVLPWRAEQLSRSCSGGRDSVQLRPTLADSGQVSAKGDQHVATCDHRLDHVLGRLWPTWASEHVASEDQGLVHSGPKAWPNSGAAPLHGAAPGPKLEPDSQLVSSYGPQCRPGRVDMADCPRSGWRIAGAWFPAVLLR